MDLDRQDFCVISPDADRSEPYVRRALNARLEGDPNAVVTFFASDLLFEFVVPRSVNPHGGRVGRGRGAFLEALKFEYCNFECFNSEILSIHGCDKSAVARRRVLARNLGTGGMHRLDVCNLLAFRDGLVSKFVEYADTYVLDQLVRSTGEAS